MNASQIFKHFIDRYTHCQSYSDSGVVFFDTPEKTKEQIEFRTEYISPNFLRYEWQDYGPRRGKSEAFSQLQWKDGECRFEHQTSKVKVETFSELSHGIASATGCSAGAASIVPNLLLETQRNSGKHLPHLTAIELIDEEDFESEPCFVLKGKLFNKNDHTLWLSTNDYSLRFLRFDRSKIIPFIKIKALTEYTYRNVEFDAKVLV